MKAENKIPEELGNVFMGCASSFAEAHKHLRSSTTVFSGLRLEGPFSLSRKEKKSLKLLSKAFDLNVALQSLEFRELEVNHTLVAQAISAGLRKDRVSCIEFDYCSRVSTKTLKETVCQGLLERSTGFKLVLKECSSEFAEGIIEASTLRCFSLMISFMDYSTIQRPLKKLFKGNLCYISLIGMKGFNVDVALQFARCLIPSLARLSLIGTVFPTRALKRLHGSLKTILDSGRSNMIEIDLANDALEEKLCFAYFRLLGTDLVRSLSLSLKKELPRAVVKSISSSLANTKNLIHVKFRNKFSSGTEFKYFRLQENTDARFGPFQVNPTVTPAF